MTDLMNWALMNIHRDILETVKPTKVLKAFIDKNPREVKIKKLDPPLHICRVELQNRKSM